MNQKMVWYDARTCKNENVLSFVYNHSFSYILVNIEAFKQVKAPRKVKFIIEVNKKEEIDSLEKEHVIFSKNEEILKYAREKEFKAAVYLDVNDEATMNHVCDIGNKYDFVIINFKEPTNIPLELIIAKMQGKNTRVLKVVDNCLDMQIAFGVMESGSDGVLFNSSDIQEIKRVDNFIEKESITKIPLVSAKVIENSYIGMGERVCIDTVSILKKNEGMIIGSTSEGGLLVSSENHYLPYMELRPFRVNAGALHSYIWTPDGKTQYLTELKAGNEVLAVDTDGNVRTVVVGRVKIEKRPLLKIMVELEDGRRLNTIVQDDWHIRIFGGNKEVRNASMIEPGDEMLVYFCEGGRHTGTKIQETFLEK